VYFQTLGELGFPGLLLYVTFVLMGIGAASRTWRATALIAQRHPDLAWVRDVSFWMMCSFIGYVFGSAFLNMFYIEFPWTAMILGSLLLPMVQQEVARRDEAKIQGTTEERQVEPRWGAARRAGQRRKPV
jgi:O-antigen ligase